MKPLLFNIVLSFFILSNCTANKTFYVDINGSDSTGDGSVESPWRTIQYAVTKIPADENCNLKLSAGIFEESVYLTIPSGVNVQGEGQNLTVLKSHPSLHSKDSSWQADKFLLNLSGSGGNQTVRDLTIDGNSKGLYGGIMVRGRSNIIIQRVGIHSCHFTGIWLWDAIDCRVTELTLENNTWGSGSGSSGSIMLTGGKGIEIDHLKINEELGQALDVVAGKLIDLKLHDNYFSVSPKGNWTLPSGQIPPNICVEMFNADLTNVEIYNNYFDNSLSMANSLSERTGLRTVHVYNNVFDLQKRANGEGYGIELSINDVEIAHNYFLGGKSGIVNWEKEGSPPRRGWKIHHNVFYGMGSRYPSGVINFYKSGIDGASIYNNTVEMIGASTISFIEINTGGVAKNMKIENNLIINSNSSYDHFPNKFINIINATMQNVSVKNNFLENLEFDTLNNLQFFNNYIGSSDIQKSGSRPRPYYTPKQDSPLVDAGLIVGSNFNGSAPDIGAFEVEK